MACRSCGQPRTSYIQKSGSTLPSTKVVESQSLKTTDTTRVQTAVASNPNSTSKRTVV